MEHKRAFWGKVCYVTGTVCLVITLGFWLVGLFRLFSEFYKHNGFELLILPLFKLFINPLLWISILLFKLTKRFLPDEEVKESE
jgi:hypothetical protein